MHTMSGGIHVSHSHQRREIFIASSMLCPKGGILSHQRNLETILKSVVRQLLGGHGSPLQKMFEGESYGGKGQARGTFLICSNKLCGKQGKDLRIHSIRPAVSLFTQVIYLASPHSPMKLLCDFHLDYHTVTTSTFQAKAAIGLSWSL